MDKNKKEVSGDDEIFIYLRYYRYQILYQFYYFIESNISE